MVGDIKMEIDLRTKKNYGVFVNICKYGIYIYFHIFKMKAMRLEFTPWPRLKFWKYDRENMMRMEAL